VIITKSSAAYNFQVPKHADGGGQQRKSRGERILVSLNRQLDRDRQASKLRIRGGCLGGYQGNKGKSQSLELIISLRPPLKKGGVGGYTSTMISKLTSARRIGSKNGTNVSNPCFPMTTFSSALWTFTNVTRASTTNFASASGNGTTTAGAGDMSRACSRFSLLVSPVLQCGGGGLTVGSEDVNAGSESVISLMMLLKPSATFWRNF
jgi:hypothetical protein